MSDCGITTDKIDQAIANYCSDTTKELDNLTEELKSDSELEFTINKMNNINITNDIQMRSEQHNGDLITKQLLHDAVDGYMMNGIIGSGKIEFDDIITNHQEHDRSTSPFYTRLNENIVENSFNNVLYTEQKPICTQTSAVENSRSMIYHHHHQNGNLNDFTDLSSTNSANDVCNELMLHSVNLDDGMNF